MKTEKKMSVEIWSDVTCTFCYTAKRKFEHALARFRHKERIEITWRSFELTPGLQTNPDKKLPQFLAELQGVSLEQARAMTNQLTNTVKELGLDYELEKAIPANSFKAHQLSHLAKEKGLQNQAEERLFKAYFTEGKNIDDLNTLLQLATEIGLAGDEVKNALEHSTYAENVRRDIDQAKQQGVNSVPFFVFNSKTTISGAQESDVFLTTLEKTYGQWLLEKPGINDGQSCRIGENCN